MGAMALMNPDDRVRGRSVMTYAQEAARARAAREAARKAAESSKIASWLDVETPQQVEQRVRSGWTPVAFDPKMDEAGLRRQASARARAQVDPLVGATGADYDRQAAALGQAITGYTKTFMDRTAGIDDAVRAAYDRAKAQQTALNDQTSEELAASGRALAGSLGAEIAAAGGTNAFSAPLATLGAGAGKQLSSLGGAALSNLISQGAGQEAMAASIPGYAEGYGKWLLAGELGALGREKASALGELRAKIPALEESLYDDLYTRGYTAKSDKYTAEKAERDALSKAIETANDTGLKKAINAQSYAAAAAKAAAEGKEIDYKLSASRGYLYYKDLTPVVDTEGNMMPYTETSGSGKTPRSFVEAARAAHKDFTKYANQMYKGEVRGGPQAALGKTIANERALEMMMAHVSATLAGYDATPEQIETVARAALVAGGYTKMATQPGGAGAGGQGEPQVPEELAKSVERLIAQKHAAGTPYDRTLESLVRFVMGTPAALRKGTPFADEKSARKALENAMRNVGYPGGSAGVGVEVGGVVSDMKKKGMALDAARSGLASFLRSQSAQALRDMGLTDDAKIAAYVDKTLSDAAYPGTRGATVAGADALERNVLAEIAKMAKRSAAPNYKPGAYKFNTVRYRPGYEDAIGEVAAMIVAADDAVQAELGLVTQEQIMAYAERLLNRSRYPGSAANPTGR